jgi:hypothetical protein
VNSCAACGKACDTTTNSARSCDGKTCLYTCSPGRQNCDQTAPDTNGCECVGTGCCGAGCQTEHSNGVGQSFYDCTALGTIDYSHAIMACAAYTKDAAACTPQPCVYNAGSLVCSPGPSCYCWKYEAGNSSVNGKVRTTCTCPITNGDPAWN